MSESPATILLIDDHPLLRQGIKQLIDMEDDMDVAGEASNAADGIRLATELEPDLILMDLNMPEMDGLEATRLIRQQGETVPIIALSAHVGEQEIDGFIKAGMNDVLRKPFREDQLFCVLDKWIA